MTKDEALRLALEEINRLFDTEKITGATTETIQAIKAALEAKDEPWEKFCDSHCVWTDHHPDCKLAERLPLTDEQIYKASTQAGMQEHYMGFHSGFIRFARAIEAAHGIKGAA